MEREAIKYSLHWLSTYIANIISKVLWEFCGSDVPVCDIVREQILHDICQKW